MNALPMIDRTPLPMARLLRSYWMEVRMETLAALRTQGYALPFLLAPVGIYLLFGVLIGGNAPADRPGLANYLYVGFAVLAASMPGLFSGVILAQEREHRLLLLKRALPLPPAATLLAKVLMAMAVSGIGIALVTMSALLAGKLTVNLTQLGMINVVLLIGSVPFTALGLWIGTLTSASAAPAWGNLVFFPMTTLSGLFIPLPAALEPWVIIWPTFQLNQLALGMAGVAEFTFIPPALAGGALLGLTVLCGGLAIGRLARVG